MDVLSPRQLLVEALAWLAFPRFGFRGKADFADVLEEWDQDRSLLEAWLDCLPTRDRSSLRSIIKCTGTLLADPDLAEHDWVYDLSSAPTLGPKAPETMHTATQLAHRILNGTFVEEFIAWRIADAPEGAWQAELALVRSCGYRIEKGLSEEELKSAEEYVGATFPGDLRAFLQVGLPVGKSFPNWRRLEDCATFMNSRHYVYEDLARAVQEHDLWWPEWGEKPAGLAQALALVRGHVDRAPRLVSIYSHRKLPVLPCEPGNPVFSVWGSDTIYYGSNLSDYLYIEFGGKDQQSVSLDELRRIDFWADLVDHNGWESA